MQAHFLTLLDARRVFRLNRPAYKSPCLLWILSRTKTTVEIYPMMWPSWGCLLIFNFHQVAQDFLWNSGGQHLPRRSINYSILDQSAIMIPWVSTKRLFITIVHNICFLYLDVAYTVHWPTFKTKVSVYIWNVMLLEYIRSFKS